MKRARPRGSGDNRPIVFNGRKNKTTLSCADDSTFVAEASGFLTKKAWRDGHPRSYGEVMRYRRHLIRVCTQHMLPTKNPFSPCYDLYLYLFRGRRAYVGITQDPATRHGKEGHQKRGPASVLIKSGVRYRFYVVKRGLTPTEAGQREDEWIDKLRARGYVLLNRRPGGSLGAIRRFTYEDTLRQARECSSRVDFERKHYGAYQRARKYGWIDKIAKTLGWKKLNETIWTYEKCLESARTCSSRVEWLNRYPVAYCAAAKKRWLDRIYKETDLRKIDQSGPVKWTFEACRERARQFKTRAEWQYNSGDASYQCARRRGWLVEICQQTQLKSLRTAWTRESCIESARPYRTKEEWRRACASYQWAKKERILPEIWAVSRS